MSVKGFMIQALGDQHFSCSTWVSSSLTKKHKTRLMSLSETITASSLSEKKTFLPHQ
jgi:hypothetical protein